MTRATIFERITTPPASKATSCRCPPPPHWRHRAYETYIFLGKNSGSRTAYNFDDPASFYYFYQSRLSSGKGEIDWQDQRQWHRIQGIEITKAQFDEIHGCRSSFSTRRKPTCKPYLHAQSIDLTADQRAYIEAHPYGEADFKAYRDYFSTLRSNPWK